MTGPDVYYHTFRALKRVAQEVYDHDKLAAAESFEDVARTVRYSFDSTNRAKVGLALGITNPNQFDGLLEFGAAIARIQMQISDGGWNNER